MRRLFIPLVFGMALVGISLSTYSAPWGWSVQKTSGSAVYSKGIGQLPLRTGLVLDRGTILQTGANGKVFLVRSEESVFIGPYTVAAIAARPTPGMKTTVLLQSGHATLTVQKKSKAHFSVETPYLVAVVKGTTFKVAVAHASAEVSVQKGVVEVKALKSGLKAEVLGGQKAVVDAVGNLKLSGRGKLATIRKGISRKAAVNAAGASRSSNVSSSGNISAGSSVNSGGVSVGGSASIGGASIGAGASVGGSGASVGAGASVGGIGAGVGASVGGGGIGVGGGISVGGGSLGVGLGIGGL